MTTAWQSEALGWLGIDVWQQSRPLESAEAKAVVEAEPQARVDVDMPVERRSASAAPAVSPLPDPEPAQIAGKAPPAKTVVPPASASTETATLTLRIEAPADGALRLLAERIAKVGRLPAASIVVVASEQAAVQLGEQRWAFSDLVAEPSRKRELWRRLCRR